MFTGLVECVGVVRSVSYEGGGVHRIGIDAPSIAQFLKRGESVSVSGACLTVVESWGDTFYAQMMSETMGATRLGMIKPGDRLNLERPLRVGDRLDGHMVLGHVDGVGKVSRLEDEGVTKKIWITPPDDIAWGVAAKGSIAVDGVSLTVIDQPGEHSYDFSIGVIPTTLRETTIGDLTEGRAVNIEIDVLIRYAARLLRADGESDGASDALSREKLLDYGWDLGGNE
ncbi:MAG: riboflavin synthase [Synergistaceae bacterium]|nr:riboflavin synthase [Synergistaceae bacterium]